MQICKPKLLTFKFIYWFFTIFWIRARALMALVPLGSLEPRNGIACRRASTNSVIEWRNEWTSWKQAGIFVFCCMQWLPTVSPVEFIEWWCADWNKKQVSWSQYLLVLKNACTFLIYLEWQALSVSLNILGIFCNQTFWKLEGNKISNLFFPYDASFF